MSKQDHPGDVRKVRKFEHPGRGRVRARSVPKGRQVDPQSTQTIQGAAIAGRLERGECQLL
jgi:formate dehydrogenase beta subunit